MMISSSSGHGQELESEMVAEIWVMELRSQNVTYRIQYPYGNHPGCWWYQNGETEQDTQDFSKYGGEIRGGSYIKATRQIQGNVVALFGPQWKTTLLFITF